MEIQSAPLAAVLGKVGAADYGGLLIISADSGLP